MYNRSPQNDARGMTIRPASSSAGIYSDRTLSGWDAPAAAAALWERAKHLQDQVDYWKRRANSAESRMLAHHCQEDQ